jgi:hypothetical protein
MKTIVLLLLETSIALSLPAQDFPRTEIDLHQIADQLYGFQDLDLNYEELYENLVQFFSHPMDLNKASAEDLRLLKVLSETQLQNLIAHRSTCGDFLSVYELQAVPGFDAETFYRLVPFVTVTDPAATINASLLRRIRSDGENYFLVRYEQTLEAKKGFTSETGDARFEGSPGKLYMRFRSSKPGDFSAGFTAEKDDGEAIAWTPSRHRYGFDYLSFHVQLQHKGRLKNMVLGDFQYQFGQGLVLGGGLGMGKGGETITTTRRSNIGLMPGTSTNEASFLRGAAATVEIRHNFYATGFYSRARRDAALPGAAEDDDVTVSSFQTTGLHRNQKELRAKHTTGEQNAGLVFEYKSNQLTTGAIFNRIDFDHSIERRPTPYNQFAFKGKSNTTVGFFMNSTFRNVAFSSEVSHSLFAGAAAVASLLCSVSPRLDIAFLFRKYDRDFYSFYSSAFGESSVPQNETGTYWGWKYRASRKFSFSGYFDLFYFRWLKFRSYIPSSGHEWLLRLDYQPSRKVLFFVQAREEVKVRNLPEKDPVLYLTGKGKKHNFLISSDYGIQQKIRFKTRAQFSRFLIDGVATAGMALMQDISVQTGRIQVTGRYALFDTEDYDNRQYAYENDVWLAYSLPAYDGQGIRRCLVVEYKINKHLCVWLRYAHTRYTDREEIGSGLDTIAGNTRNDLKFQARLRF